MIDRADNTARLALELAAAKAELERAERGRSEDAALWESRGKHLVARAEAAEAEVERLRTRLRDWQDAHKVTKRRLMAAEAEVKALRKLLSDHAGDALEDVQEWGSYASGYFQEKWDLAGTVAKWERRRDLNRAQVEQGQAMSEDPDRPTTQPLTRCPECGDVNGFHKTGCESAPVEYGGDSKKAATFHDGSE
jgi:chromosome condensin MukBEF ATPase and DNA-binding subunit MukB